MKSFAQCLKGMWQANTRSHCPRNESEHEPTLIQKCCEHVSDHNSSVVQVLASQCQFLGFVLGFGQILCLPLSATKPHDFLNYSRRNLQFTFAS